MPDLQKLKMNHAILVNEKETVTNVATQIYCTAMKDGGGGQLTAAQAVDMAVELVEAAGKKYDGKIDAAETAVLEAMEEAEKTRAEMQRAMMEQMARGEGGPARGMRAPRGPGGCPSGGIGCEH